MNRTTAVLAAIAPFCLLLASGCPSAPAGSPDAQFDANVRYGRAVLTVQFTDNSDPGDAPITAWQWDFGDGSTSNEQNPTHAYKEAGSFTVSLEVTNEIYADTLSLDGYIIVGNVWARTFGGSGNDYGRSACALDDGYAVAGTSSSGKGDSDVLLVRLDTDGNEVWTETFGGNGNDDSYGVLQADNGDLVVVGTTNSKGNGGYDMYLLCTSANGVEKWSKTYGGGGNDRGYAVAPTSDGGFILAGETFSSGPNLGGNAYLVKVGSTGTQQWAQAMDSPGPATAYAVQQTEDGGYILAGSIKTAEGGIAADAYLAKTDNAGAVTWTWIYGDTGEDEARGVYQAADNGYFVVGKMLTKTLNGMDLYFLRTDAEGNEQWSDYYGSSKREEGRGLLKDPNGGYLLVGLSTTNTAGGEDVFAVKATVQGEVRWSRRMGGSGNDAARAAVTGVNGGFLLVGTTRSYGAGGADIYVLKTNNDGYGPSDPATVPPDTGGEGEGEGAA